jgi:diaminopimelate epimerase
MAREIPFVKMDGLGNDYVFLDTVRHDLPRLRCAELARSVSDRHTGVGSDGLIVLSRGRGGRFRMRMYNADGSEGEMCGNGVRCLARLVHERHSKVKTQKFVTGAGPIVTRIVETGEPYVVEVDMGAPILEPERIPVVAKSGPVVGMPLNDGYNVHTATAVSMGNPHAVIFVEHFDWPWEQAGSRLERNPAFPNRTNVEFVRVLAPDHLRVRLWERGTGVTRACGTGACAATVAGVLTGRAKRDVTVTLDGGDLRVRWDEETNHVFLTGPASLNFSGKYRLK